jgi:hypothetical protein
MAKINPMKSKMKLMVLPVVAITAFSLAGCASYTIQPVHPEEISKWKEGKPGAGYVFYQPELYFLVTSAPSKITGDTAPAKASAADGPAASFSVTPLYLPNPGKPYRVTTFNFLAKSDFTFNFKDGWQLTSIADKADNSGAATALVGQMKTILDAAVKGVAPGPGNPPPRTFLLHPKFNDAGIITGFDKPIVCPDF